MDPDLVVKSELETDNDVDRDPRIADDQKTSTNQGKSLQNLDISQACQQQNVISTDPDPDPRKSLESSGVFNDSSHAELVPTVSIKIERAHEEAFNPIPLKDPDPLELTSTSIKSEIVAETSEEFSKHGSAFKQGGEVSKFTNLDTSKRDLTEDSKRVPIIKEEPTDCGNTWAAVKNEPVNTEEDESAGDDEDEDEALLSDPSLVCQQMMTSTDEDLAAEGKAGLSNLGRVKAEVMDDSEAPAHASLMPDPSLMCQQTMICEDNIKEGTEVQSDLDNPELTVDTDEVPVIDSTKPNTCNACNIKFARAYDLGKHLAKFHRNGKFCPVCKKIFENPKNLRKHLRIHTGEKPYECSVCQRGFTQSSSLKIHSRVHTGERPFQCDVCNKTFSQASYLKVHKMIHTGERPHVCDVCHKTFRQAINLTVHMKVHSGDRPFECEHCEKTYKHAEGLKNHMVVHTAEMQLQNEAYLEHTGQVTEQVSPKPPRNHFECELCAKICGSMGTLKSHMKSHSSDRPFECSVCPKKFKVHSALKVHMMIHTGEKPFQCDECQRCFREAQTLVDHKRVHSGERPFQCSICFKSFGRANYLRGHMRTHTGEKPYKCDVCPKQFARGEHLKKHMQIHNR